jgi:hypothetical protein
MNKITQQKLALAGIFLITILLSARTSWAKPNVNQMLASHRHDYPTPTAISLIEPQVSVATESVE